MDLFGRSFPASANASFVAAIGAAMAAEDWPRLGRGLAKAVRAAQSGSTSAAGPAFAAEWAALSAEVAAFDRHRLAVQVRPACKGEVRRAYRRIRACAHPAFILRSNPTAGQRAAAAAAAPLRSRSSKARS